MPKCAEIIRTDSERDVVIAGLDVYTELLREMGVAVLTGEGHGDAIINCVKDVLNCRVNLSIDTLFHSMTCIGTTQVG